MQGVLYAFPSSVSWPSAATVRRGNSHIRGPWCLLSTTKLLPFGPTLLRTSFSANLRPRSALLCGLSSKLFVGYRNIKSDVSLSDGQCRMASAEVTATDSSISNSQNCLETQSAANCSSSEDMNALLIRLKPFYCSLLRLQSSLTYPFSSPIMRHGKINQQSSLVYLATSYGRFLLIGVIFVLLHFTPGKMFSQHALASPTSTSTESKKYPQGQMQGKLRRDGHVGRDGREMAERRPAEVTEPEYGNVYFDKMAEEISVADKKEIEIHLKFLMQEEKLLAKRVDTAAEDYFFAKAKLDRSGDVGTTQKEEFLREKLDVLVKCRRKLLELVAAWTKISQRIKEIADPRQTRVEQHRPSMLSKIASDLEQLKSTFREHELLPLAAKIETEEVRKPAETADTTILNRIELEQTISLKLKNLLEKLVTRLDVHPVQEDLDLEQSMSELRDLILDKSRWQGDMETRNALIENRHVPEKFSAKEQDDILVARDRVLNNSWYDEKKRRWEMQPSAALYAVEQKLAGQARVRHDRRVMYLTLKGKEQEYFVNTKLFNAKYEDYGGFRTLYWKMIASGVPVSVEKMWIPLNEWEPGQLLKLPFKLIWWLLEDFWNSSLVGSVRPWYFSSVMGAFEEVMIRFGFPIIQRIVPQKARVHLGFELPEGAEAAEPTNIIIWQQEAQKHVDARYAEGSGSPAWWISLPVRCYVLGLPLFIVLRFVVGLVVRPFRPQPLAMNDVEWKEKKQEELMKKLGLQTKKQTIDPIKNVFDNMKRVRRPEVRLKDFAGIDVIKEEISEIISFLKNPKLFREMGARPPRGVLIIGESGTGKTTLALAIAAEARVPMVELQGSELEGGAWVGQGASNVRELFKTARELAPLIIFMDDFDHFAGVRGATSDTRKQDHESLINQLLVELDGFETQEGVVLVATTSRPFAIDEALRRPGRMDRTIQLPMPNKREREQILRQSAHKTMDAHLVDHVDWAKVAEKTAGLTPARLKYVPEGLEGSAVSYKYADQEELFFIFGWLAAINKISPRWIKESNFTKNYNDMLLDWLDLRVTKEDLEDAVEYLDVFGESKPGIEFYDPPYVWTRKFKFPHAVWGVGKGLIALLLPDFDVVDMIWLNPTSWEGIAFTKFTKKVEGGYEETGTLTRSYCEKELVSYFGSFVASRMLLPFGENNNLCKAEMDSAKEVATRMVMEYGWAPDDSPMIYMTASSPTALAMGDKHEMEVAEKINQLFFRACEKASHMLEQNRPVLEAMLEHLLEFDVLNHQEMRRIFDEKGAVFEELPFSLLPFTQTEIVGVSTNGTGRLGKESAILAVS